MFKALTMVLIFASISTFVEAAVLNVETSSGTNLQFETIDGEAFPTQIDMNTTKAKLCAAETISYDDIYLWMKMGNHEHGTSPIDVNRTSARCVELSNLDFLMPGWWELRIFTSKGNAVLRLEVVN